MAQETATNINPKVLQWARKEMSLSEEELADKLGLSKEDIFKIERGESQLSFSQVRDLTRILEIPIAAFYLTVTPEELEKPPDYRSRGEPFTKKTLLSFRRVSKIRDSYLELGKSLGQRTKSLDISLTQSNLIENAEKIRGLLGISSELQFSAKNSETFFNILQEKLESFGILVLEMTLPRTECQGFSYSKLPITIVVNHSDAYQAKLFTLVHELGHILTRTSSVCLADPFYDQVKIEQICNKFASKFLIPSDDLRSFIDTSGFIQEEKIKELANKFNVSKYVMLFRLYEQRLIDPDLKDQLYSEWLDADKNREVFRRAGRPENKAIRENGQLFTTLVYRAYDNSVIDYVSIHRYLSVNPSLTNKIGERFGQ